MRYNGFSKDEIEPVRSAMKSMNMPCTLKDLNYEPSNDNLLFYIDHMLKIQIFVHRQKNPGLLKQ